MGKPNLTKDLRDKRLIELPSDYPKKCHKYSAGIVIPYSEIEEQTKKLGKIISKKYKGGRILAVPIFCGAKNFWTLLRQYIKGVAVVTRSFKLSSYEKTESSGKFSYDSDRLDEIQKIAPLMDVVLGIEDIVDSGNTLNFLHQNIPKFRICTLLSKPEKMLPEYRHLGPEYCLFNVGSAVSTEGEPIESVFLFGFGMDLYLWDRNGEQDKSRELPDVHALKPKYYDDKAVERPQKLVEIVHANTA
ncbi:hypothetical protein KY339_00355 [Candidatus Woesearchaeota archaeon]|nr:hypothetical protein [Candidatus Woesearchaeota archaeon]